MSQIYSAVWQNGTAVPVQIESIVHKRALPQLIIHGLPSGVVGEVRERVLSALRSVGVRLPHGRLILEVRSDITPRHTRQLDVPLFLAVLQGIGRISNCDPIFALGGLRLDGHVVSYPELFALVQARSEFVAQKMQLLFPVHAPFLSLLPAYWQQQLACIDHVNQLLQSPPIKVSAICSTGAEYQPSLDQSLVDVQWSWVPAEVVEVLAIALAGYHHVLLFGAPGLGKSHMQQLVAALWPPEPPAVLYQRAIVSSRAGMSNFLFPLQVTGSSPTLSQLRGSRNTPIQDGHIHRSHFGALWCEELPLWSKSCIEELRPLLEATGNDDSVVTRCIATLNPCPCGYAGESRCTCPSYQVQRYQQRVPAALLDRFAISMRFGVPEHIAEQAAPELVDQYRASIARAWERQTERAHGGCRQWNQWYRWLEGTDAPGDFPDDWARQLQRWSPRRRLLWWRVCRTLADMSELGAVTEETRSQAYALTRPIRSWAQAS